VLRDVKSFPGSVSSVDWSPDGATFALSSSPVPHGPENIYRMAVTGGAIRQLTTTDGTEPEWSPDGSKIAYAATGVGGAADIFLMNADGSNRLNLTKSAAAEMEPSWSPDGTKLLFSRYISEATHWDIWSMNLDGTQQKQLTRSAEKETDPAWQGRSNVLFNDGFEGGNLYWQFQTNGKATFATSKPAYRGEMAGKVTVAKAASQLQLFEKLFRLEPKTRYRLSFAAYATAGHDLAVYLHSHSNPSLNYGLSNYRFNLTAGWKMYSVEFVTKNFPNLTTDTRLRFWLGPYAKAGDIYWLDAISLAKVAGTTAAAAGQGTGSVIGQVALPVTEASGLSLELVDLETDGATYQAITTTDATGQFYFDSVPYGAYELRRPAFTSSLAFEPVQLTVGAEPNEALILAESISAEADAMLFLPAVIR